MTDRVKNDVLTFVRVIAAVALIIESAIMRDGLGLVLGLLGGAILAGAVMNRRVAS